MRALHTLAMACIVAMALTAVVAVTAYPIQKCGFWPAIAMGRGALPAALMGLCDR